MILCAAGDIHGAMDRLYEDVLAFEQSLNVRFDWVLHVGDFGVWPDPERVDRATRDHDGAGDFPRWFAEKRAAPRRTVFIKGNHEDFEWLDSQHDREILPGLIYLPNGRSIELDAEGEKGRLRVAGLGGCYGPSNYERKSKDLRGYSKRHYTEDEIVQLPPQGAADILLLHDAPLGTEFVQRRPKGERRYTSTAVGLTEAVTRVRPRVCFFGHHHNRVDWDVDGIKCVGLNVVRRPGNLVAIEVPVKGRQWQHLGEWPLNNGTHSASLGATPEVSS